MDSGADCRIRRASGQSVAQNTIRNLEGMMMESNQILTHLDALPPRSRTAFAALRCERLLPAYQAFQWWNALAQPACSLMRLMQYGRTSAA